MRLIGCLFLMACAGAASAQDAGPPAPRLMQPERPDLRPEQEAAPQEPPAAEAALPAPPPGLSTTPPLGYSPPDPAEPAPQQPLAPPIHQTLREDDFTFSACLLELSLLGADYSVEAPLTDPEHRDCGIDRPIMLRAPLPGVQINGGALMRCETAWHLAHWLRDSVRPALSMLPGQPRLSGIQTGSTYQCRVTVGDKGENLSEHAFGNAFDVSALTFSDGSQFVIEPRDGKGDMAEAVQAAIRGAACLHFTTVLGPGANAAHDDHLHLDIKARDSGWRLCQ